MCKGRLQLYYAKQKYILTQSRNNGNFSWTGAIEHGPGSALYLKREEISQFVISSEYKIQYRMVWGSTGAHDTGTSTSCGAPLTLKTTI